METTLSILKNKKTTQSLNFEFAILNDDINMDQTLMIHIQVTQSAKSVLVLVECVGNICKTNVDYCR